MIIVLNYNKNIHCCMVWQKVPELRLKMEGKPSPDVDADLSHSLEAGRRKTF